MSEKLLMVVEDDVELRETLCDLLSDEGYRTVSRSNGLEALEYLRSGDEKPALILLDLMMPGMNGWEFRRHQLGDPGLAAIPVIVLTAGRRIDSEQLESATVLQKPLDLNTLLSEVTRLAAAGPG